MKRKQSVKQLENLKPIKSKKEARELGRKGGIESGIAKRQAKTFQEMAKLLLNETITTKSGITMTNREAITIAQIKSARKGNTFAFTTIRDTAEPKDTKQDINPITIIIDNKASKV